MGRRFAYILMLVLSQAAVLSCADRAVRQQLNNLETLVQTKPDSALKIIRSIDTLRLKSSDCRAKYSLLHTMALDKNYIDTANLDILQPAIRRYTQHPHFNNLDKFFTWYYRGRIEENGKDYISALQSFLQAEKYMNATDDRYRTRLYFSFERIYTQNLSFEKVYDAALTALHFARTSGDKYNYAASLIDCVSASISLNRFEESKEYLDEYDLVLGGDAYFQKASNYYLSKMIFFGACQDQDSTLYYYRKYAESTTNTSVFDILNVLRSCIRCGAYSTAQEILNAYPDYSFTDPLLNALYYGYRSVIKQKAGDINGALEDLNEYCRFFDRQDIREDNMKVSMAPSLFKEQLKRTRLLLAAVSFFSIFIIGLILLIMSSRKKAYQYEMLTSQYEAIKEEKDFLIQKSKGSIKDIEEKLLKIGRPANKDKTTLLSSVKLLSKTLSPKEFVHLVSILLETKCPDFYLVLSNASLDDTDCTICTLLILGLSEKEISSVINSNSIRNTCSEIRKKLGFDAKNGYLSSALKNLYMSI